MGVVTRRPGLPLWSDHTDFVRRHRRFLGGLMATGLLAGAAWSLQQPTTYSATASVALAPVPVYVMTTTDELVPPEVSVDTDAQLLMSGEVLDAIGEVLDTDREQAAEHLTVTASAHTHVLHATVTAGSAEQAAQAANAAVNELANARARALGALQDEQLRNLRMLVGNHTGDLRDALEEAEDELLFSTEDERFAQVLAARASLDELEEARAAPAEVVRPAVPPRSADYANTEVPIVSGAMLGLLAGCLVGAARDRFRLLGPSPGEPPDSRLPPLERTTRTSDDKDRCHAD
jgi:uncharacterized protein involved in exopolysaccharide biosynthesis